ncbi:MAG TPA: malto-oligosyltrehalose trehalohydrolase [Gemmatimonadales bacterium]|jgi:maltooligosyltrehalose trehalohydrolase
MPRVRRRLPIGAEPQAQGGVAFRVWAPKRSNVEIVVEGGGAVSLSAEAGGYFAGFHPDAGPGSRYRFRLDGGDRLLPDPASRFQPEGPHGPSEVIDPLAYRWSDDAWQGVRTSGHVIYEMHVGTFTAEGTFAAATAELEYLARMGITLVEIMPIAEFSGRFGWGYDGVNFFAPTRLYGHPDDVRRLVDRAHALGMGVILDVVYNHCGPDGNYLPEFSDDYMSRSHSSEWGDTLNYDGPGCRPVREMVISNAGYWIEEFHFDGLRLDATQQIFDDSGEHIIAALTQRAREVARRRRLYIVAENEVQDVRGLMRREMGGYELTALWNDDFHHAAMVALTGSNEAYYKDYRGAPQEFVSAARQGFLFQGQWYSWQRQRRGTPTRGIAADRFVTYLENHDQVANSRSGARLHQITSPGSYRALTALLLLGPQTPLIFQGQEYGARQPFLFFADHEGDLRNAVRKGRLEFLTQFSSLAGADVQRRLADPCDPATFERCKLDPSERRRDGPIVSLHTDLLRLRREDPVFAHPADVDGAVLAERAFMLRWFGEEGDDRVLLVNLGESQALLPVSEPLLAAPRGMDWATLWSSDDERYGGPGASAIDTTAWFLPRQSAVVLWPRAVAGGDG